MGGVEFRDVVPGYRVSADGGVWSLQDGQWRRLKGRPNRKGHLQVTIKSRMFYVHRLILLAFRGPCPPGMQGRHLDDNPGNNNLENLAYGTRLDNAADAIRNGRQVRGERHGRAKLTTAKVRRIHKMAARGKSRAEIARRFRVSDSTIGMIVRGLIWRHLLPAEATAV